MEISDMWNLSLINKREIYENRMYNPDKYLSKEESLKIRIMKWLIFWVYLEKESCKNAIEKNSSNNEYSDELITTTLQFLINGFNGYKKHLISIEDYLNNEKQKKNYLNFFIQCFSKATGLSKDKIIATFPLQQSSFFMLVIKDNRFNKITQENLNQIFIQSNELGKLVSIQTFAIVDCFKLNKKMHSYVGDNADEDIGQKIGRTRFEWGINEKRGNKTYNPQ